MKIQIAAAALLLSISTANAWEYARNPDRFPSVGVNAFATDLKGNRDTIDIPDNPAIHRFQRGNVSTYNRSIEADIRLPISDWTTVSLFGAAITNDAHYINGAHVYEEHGRQTGYRVGIGLRLYFNQ